MAPGFVLLFEQLQTRHADHTRGDALGFELLSCCKNDFDLRARGQQHDLGRSLCRLRQYIASTLDAVLVRGGVVVDGKVLTRQGESHGTGAMLHGEPPGGGCFTGVCRAHHQQVGMTRNAAKDSTGWWVGPSSPSPMESCVKT